MDLKELNKKLREEIAEKALTRKPYLAIIQVGDNPASNIYVRNKIKACEGCGVDVRLEKLPEDISEEALVNLIGRLNNSETKYPSGSRVQASWKSLREKEDIIKFMKTGGWVLFKETMDYISFEKEREREVTGIIVQMPLPKHIDPMKVCMAIDPLKDVDGFNPVNVGKHALGVKDCIVPATVRGISLLMDNLQSEGIIGDTKGMNCVIIGRSNIVGKPMAYEMINKFSCTVTVCNSNTPIGELWSYCNNADILISAVGKPNFITKDFFYDKGGSKPVVIDVGINRLPDGKVVGDCDYEGIKDYCSYITPVPGGVGPLTITGLLYNLVYEKEIYKTGN